MSDRKLYKTMRDLTNEECILIADALALLDPIDGNEESPSKYNKELLYDYYNLSDKCGYLENRFRVLAES